MTSTLNSEGNSIQIGAKRAVASSVEGSSSPVLTSSKLACFQTGHAQRVASWNAEAEDLLGWKAHDVVHHPLVNILADAGGGVSLIAAHPATFRTDTAFKKANGETLEVELWSTTLPNDEGQLFLLQDAVEKKFLETALLDAADREQRRIGQDLHDHLCQHLLGASFGAKALAGALDRESSPHAGNLHELARLINDAVLQVREISRGLHPVELNSAGLMSALEELADRATRVTPCSFRCDRQMLVRSQDAAVNAYRIAQAAVTAALRETGAKNINITLSHVESSISLVISDDGTTEGELTANPSGVDAKTLQYRAQAMQASLTLNFRPGKGTLVTCLFRA